MKQNVTNVMFCFFYVLGNCNRKISFQEERINEFIWNTKNYENILQKGMLFYEKSRKKCALLVKTTKKDYIKLE